MSDQANTAATAAIESLQPAPKIVEQVYKAILDAICEGRLEPGERLGRLQSCVREMRRRRMRMRPGTPPTTRTGSQDAA